MIFEAIVGLLIGVVDFVAGLFGNLPAPGWLSGVSDAWQYVVNLGGGLSAWVPWSFMTAAIGSVLACLVIGFSIKCVRLVLSLFTGGGGSAA